MEDQKNACYQSAKIIEEISSQPDQNKLSTALSIVFPHISQTEARLGILAILDDAIEEVSLIPNLTDTGVSSMLAEIRQIQGRLLMALPQETVKAFKAHAKFENAIEKLNLIGHTLATSHISRNKRFDRKTFLAETEEMLEGIGSAPINPMQKSVLELKLRSIIRIMHECEGATDEQIRRRLKNIFADLQAEFEHIDEEQKEFLEKFKGWVSNSMKSGAFALGLTADTLSVLSIAGPAAAAVLLSSADRPLMIEGPSHPPEEESTSQHPE